MTYLEILKLAYEKELENWVKEFENLGKFPEDRLSSYKETKHDENLNELHQLIHEEEIRLLEEELAL